MRAIYLNTDDNTGNGDSRIDWYRVTGAVTGTPVDEIHDATYGVTDDNTLLDADGCPIVECNQTYADVRRAIEKKERIMNRKQAGKIAAAIGTVDTSPANVARVLRDIVAEAINAMHQAHGGLVGTDFREADELVAALEAAAPAVSSGDAERAIEKAVRQGEFYGVDREQVEDILRAYALPAERPAPAVSSEPAKEAVPNFPVGFALMNLLNDAVMYVAKGINEGVYTGTAGGDKCAERLLARLQAASEGVRQDRGCALCAVAASVQEATAEGR